MTSTLSDLLRQSLAGLRLLLVLTVLLGVGYPVAIWLAAQPLGDRAAGQPVRVDGQVVGSALLGQEFTGAAWFHARPSANDYDTLASGPSNLGPLNPELAAAIKQRRAAVAEADRVGPGQVPADALASSGSGLDPHISPAYAAIQVDRVAEANAMTAEQVRDLVADNTDSGFLSPPTVNVTTLNADLARHTE